MLGAVVAEHAVNTSINTDSRVNRHRGVDASKQQIKLIVKVVSSVSCQSSNEKVIIMITEN